MLELHRCALCSKKMIYCRIDPSRAPANSYHFFGRARRRMPRGVSLFAVLKARDYEVCGQGLSDERRIPLPQSPSCVQAITTQPPQNQAVGSYANLFLASINHVWNELAIKLRAFDRLRRPRISLRSFSGALSVYIAQAPLTPRPGRLYADNTPYSLREHPEENLRIPNISQKRGGVGWGSL